MDHRTVCLWPGGNYRISVNKQTLIQCNNIYVEGEIISIGVVFSMLAKQCIAFLVSGNGIHNTEWSPTQRNEAH